MEPELLPTKKDAQYEWLAPSKSHLLSFDVQKNGTKVNLDIQRKDGVKGALFGKPFFSHDFLITTNEINADATEEPFTVSKVSLVKS